MKPRNSFVPQSIVLVLAVALAGLASVPAAAQEQTTISVGGVDITGLPDDWSHHHLIFSNPGSEREALTNGSYDRWLSVVNDPRYVIQQLKRQSPTQGPTAQDVARIEASRAETTAVGGNQSLTPQQPIDINGGGGGGDEGNPRCRGRNCGQKLQNDWSMDIGSMAKVGAGHYPAKFSFSTGTANCASASTPDFVAYNTGLAGSSGQASIISFDNLYTGCTGIVPTPYWAYNTGGTIVTSVVLSLTGTQLAMVHSSASRSSLVLLRWKAGEGANAGSGSAAASPATPTTQTTSPSTWVTCKAGTSSCQLTLAFSGTAANVTRSAPYYDYSSDALYVGDDSGVLHKFVGVFNGTPAECTPTNTTAPCPSPDPWPITVNPGNILSSPVEDGNTHNIFVGDSSGLLSFVRDTGSTTGSCTSGNPPCLGVFSDSLTTGPIADGPLVDPSQGMVYAISGVTSARARYEVLQDNEALSISTPSSITFSGRSGQTYTSYGRIGAFDNIYYTSGPASGHLYMCAPSSGNFYNVAALYRIGFTSGGVMDTSATGPLNMASASITNGTTADDCSPLTEFYNGTTDYLFAGVYVDGNGTRTGCTSATTGCIANFNITSSFPSDSVAGLAQAGSTSGIVVDNNVTSPSGSQVYFTNLSNQACAGNSKPTGNGTGGCAIQASQSAP